MTYLPQTWSTYPSWVAEEPYWSWGTWVKSQGHQGQMFQNHFWLFEYQFPNMNFFFKMYVQPILNWLIQLYKYNTYVTKNILGAYFTNTYLQYLIDYNWFQHCHRKLRRLYSFLVYTGPKYQWRIVPGDIAGIESWLHKAWIWNLQQTDIMLTWQIYTYIHYQVNRAKYVIV